jgi:hypothetical protein
MGLAAKNNVSVGWKIFSVNGVDVTERGYSRINALLTNSSIPVSLVFQRPLDPRLNRSSDKVTVKFTTREWTRDLPFGMAFGTIAESLPKASEMVVAWRNAVQSWIRRQDLKNTSKELMEEACDRIDIDSNNEISEYEFHKVCLLLDGMEEAHELQEKMTRLGPNKERCEYSNKIFRLMDNNDDGWLSWVECFMGLHWLKDQLRLIGPPHLLVADFDTDLDGKLSEAEFSNIGTMFTPQLKKAAMTRLFHQLDVSPKDSFVTERELTFEEECSHPMGCDSKINLTRHEVSSIELKKYNDVPAVIQGRVTVSIEAPRSIPVPSNGELEQIVSNGFTDAFSKVIKSKPNLQSATAFSRGAAVKPLDDGMWTRFVLINFELDVEDGGGFQSSLQKKSGEIHKQCFENLSAKADSKEASAWLQNLKGNIWGRLSASYYRVGPEAKLPHGVTLYQDFGKMPGHQAPLLSTPFTHDVTASI